MSKCDNGKNKCEYYIKKLDMLNEDQLGILENLKDEVQTYEKMGIQILKLFYFLLIKKLKH